MVLDSEGWALGRVSVCPWFWFLGSAMAMGVSVGVGMGAGAGTGVGAGAGWGGAFSLLAVSPVGARRHTKGALGHFGT